MRFPILVLSALILAAPAGAFAQDNHPHGHHRFLNPEQRAMYMMQERKADDWQSMTREQRHEKMHALRAKFDAMTPDQKAQLGRDMQAKFDALSASEKQAIQQKIAERRARRAQMRQNKADQP